MGAVPHTAGPVAAAVQNMPQKSGKIKTGRKKRPGVLLQDRVPVKIFDVL